MHPATFGNEEETGLKLDDDDESIQGFKFWRHSNNCCFLVTKNKYFGFNFRRMYNTLVQKMKLHHNDFRFAAASPRQ